MPRMIRKHPRYPKNYGKVRLAEGDQFDASEKDAAFFRKTKWAEDAPPPPMAKTTRPYVRRDMVPEAPAAVLAPVATPEPVAPVTTETAAPIAPASARYERRDLRAAD